MLVSYHLWGMVCANFVSLYLLVVKGLVPFLDCDKDLVLLDVLVEGLPPSLGCDGRWVPRRSEVLSTKITMETTISDENVSMVAPQGTHMPGTMPASPPPQTHK